MLSVWVFKKSYTSNILSDVNLKIVYFFSIILIMIDIFFPKIKIAITEDNKKWVTSEIKHLSAERLKAHMSGNCDLTNHLA